MTSTPDAPIVEVLWRPGCGYCSRLRNDLRRRGVPATYRNIWEDSDARSIVTRINRGNETVPTVRVADTWMTNPSGARVAELASAAGVVMTPSSMADRPRPVALSIWIPVLGFVVAGGLVSLSGHGVLGLGMIVTAVAAWWFSRSQRR